jgi:hypothetical protein
MLIFARRFSRQMYGAESRRAQIVRQGLP